MNEPSAAIRHALLAQFAAHQAKIEALHTADQALRHAGAAGIETDIFDRFDLAFAAEIQPLADAYTELTPEN
ncbi:MAG: hypothetical protein ACRD1M_10290 [Terriglobales bacterium]